MMRRVGTTPTPSTAPFAENSGRWLSLWESSDHAVLEQDAARRRTFLLQARRCTRSSQGLGFRV